MLYNTSMRFLQDWNFGIKDIVTLAVLGASFLVLIALIVLFSISKHRDDNHEKEVKALSNSLRVYVVDVENDRVSYFNSSSLQKRKTSSITAFYNQYGSVEREQLINWIGNLLDAPDTTSKFLEIEVYIKATKQNVASILEVQKIDYKKRLIYLESHILQSEARIHKKGEKATFAKKDLLCRKILVGNGKGATYAFNFFNKVTKTPDISQLAYIDIRDIFLSFASDDIVVTEEGFGEILMTNFQVKGRSEILSFLETVKSKLNKYLLIKSFSEICYTIGVIENSENFRDVNALIKNVIAVSDLCKSRQDEYAFFSDMKSMLTEEEGKQYRTDVQTILADDRLNYLFQPIYDFKRNRVFAYQSSVVPVDSYFTDIESLKNYAMRTEDDKELFSAITRNVISRFVQENNEKNVMLFFPITFNEVNFVNKSLGHTDGVNDANIVLVLKERDLSALPDEFEEETLINSIRSFKSKGYAVALEIDDNILNLSPNLYSTFDYFNLSVTTHISKKNAGQNLPSFQGLIEKLLHYEKPIVALDIQSWDIVELVYRLGVTNICSDAIALPAENIMPLSKKVVAKIQNLKS